MINFIPQIAQIDKQTRFDAITDVLEENEIPYSVQTFRYPDAIGNIIVSFNTEKSAKKIAVTAHYDNVKGTPGANDNAAACSILLNLILEAKENKTEKPLEFVFFDLEETGFVGAINYRNANSKKLACVINLDMCGMGNNTVVCMRNGAEKFLTISPDADITAVEMLPPGDAHIFMFEGFPTLYVVNSTDKDLSYYRSLGKFLQPYNNSDFVKTMHKPCDTPDTCNLAQVGKICRFVSDCIN